MKKVSYVIVIIMLLMLYMPQVMANEGHKYHYVSCGEVGGIPQPVPQMTSIAYTLLVIATPIVLIIFSIIVLVRAIVKQDPGEIVKARGSLIKKVLAAAIVFLVAGIAQFVITRAAGASEAGTMSSCLNCFLYNNGCEPWEDDIQISQTPGMNDD